jgi:hypothetical protein
MSVVSRVTADLPFTTLMMQATRDEEALRPQ